MKATQTTAGIRRILAALFCLAAACSPNNGPQTGSQTNWLRSCDTSKDCGAASCHCGACTQVCTSNSGCDQLPGSTCAAAADPGVVALCSGSKPAVVGLCLPPCEGDSCGAGLACVAGTCVPELEPQNRVTIDPTLRFQKLTGFGATLAYVEAEVLQHPKFAELREAMFSGLGLDILRLRNRFGYVGSEDLSSAGSIVEAAATSLGRTPTVIVTSWSPPAALKASGATVCSGNPDSCTLVRQADGGFNYVDYANYWRQSLDAYAAIGVLPDFIAIQNNPDFVPTSLAPGEACRFLPSEATAPVSIDGVNSDFPFPGLAQAIPAVMTALTDLQPQPKLIAPDVSSTVTVATYLNALDPTSFDVIGHHLYGSTSTNLDFAGLDDLRQLGETMGKPLFQTELQADGLDMALLLHHSLTDEGVSAFLQNALVGPEATATSNSGALIAMNATEFTLNAAYHVMRHYAAYTDPGWQRVDARSPAQELLTTAWMSPTNDRVTVVMVNSSSSELAVTLDLGQWTATHTKVIRSTFDGDEKSADLGELSPNHAVRLPKHSLLTAVLER